MTQGSFKGLILLSIFLFLVESAEAQKRYSARFQLASIDTAASIACYDLQLSNPDTVSWRLFGYNFNVFYDARVGQHLSIDDPNINHVTGVQLITYIPIGAVGNTGLSYDSIGYFRISASELIEGEGQLFEPNGEWISISQMCFDITLDDITDPATCFSINFSTPQSEGALPAQPDQVLESLPAPVFSDVMTQEARLDVLPDRSRNSCFVLEEDSQDLCSDGIDNDEDGLLDCDDPTCIPGTITISREEIECFRPEGMITLSNGQGANISYSIDGGTTFSTDSIFSGLSAGVYDIVVRRNSVSSCEFLSSVILQAPDCSEADDLTCTDGIDNNGDGLIDCDDPACQPLIDTVMIAAPIICPTLSDGTIEILSDRTDIEYSIDSGQTYQPLGLFQMVATGEYHIFSRNPVTLCAVPYIDNPIVVSPGISCGGNTMLPNFYMPNVIAPNNPPNHELGITSPEVLNLRSFEVYDRWGNQMFARANFSSADSVAWDGRDKNGDVRTGVYVFLLEFDIEGDIVATAGDVLVIN